MRSIDRAISIRQLLAADETYQGRVVDMAYSLLEELPAAGFVCIDTTVDTLTAASNYTQGADLLKQFVARVPGQIPALLKLVEVCVDGGLESDMSQTQAQLTDAYLGHGPGGGGARDRRGSGGPRALGTGAHRALPASAWSCSRFPIPTR